LLDLKDYSFKGPQRQRSRNPPNIVYLYICRSFLHSPGKHGRRSDRSPRCTKATIN